MTRATGILPVLSARHWRDASGTQRLMSGTHVIGIEKKTALHWDCFCLGTTLRLASDRFHPEEG